MDKEINIDIKRMMMGTFHVSRYTKKKIITISILYNIKHY